LPGGLECDVLGRVEKIDDIRPQIVDTPGKFDMNRGNKVHSYSEYYQNCQAEQDLYHSGDSFQHG
jgi:hypothetical protein